MIYIISGPWPCRRAAAAPCACVSIHHHSMSQTTREIEKLSFFTVKLPYMYNIITSLKVIPYNTNMKHVKAPQRNRLLYLPSPLKKVVMIVFSKGRKPKCMSNMNGEHHQWFTFRDSFCLPDFINVAVFLQKKAIWKGNLRKHWHLGISIVESATNPADDSYNNFIGKQICMVGGENITFLLVYVYTSFCGGGVRFQLRSQGFIVMSYYSVNQWIGERHANE